MSSNKPVYLASDIHLGSQPSGQEQAFLSWLDHAADVASTIVLNGDLFDFWFEYMWGPTRGYDAVLGLLRDIVEGGVPITLMGGNHDWWGGRYLRDEVGLEFLRHPIVREFAGHRTFLAHGDGLGRGDLGYRIMKPILRGWPIRTAFSLLPRAVGGRIAGRTSRTDTRWRGPDDRQRHRSAALEAWAVEKLASDPTLDLVVLGHTHIPLLRTVEKDRWYVNAGDWVFHRSYLVLDSGQPPLLLQWEPAHT